MEKVEVGVREPIHKDESVLFVLVTFFSSPGLKLKTPDIPKSLNKVLPQTGRAAASAADSPTPCSVSRATTCSV